VLDGRVVLVTGTEQPLGAGIATAIEQHGARVRDEPADDVDAVVHIAVDPHALEPQRFVDVDDDRWLTVWEGTMRSALELCQSAHRALARNRNGRVVFVVPTLGMSGAADFAPLATVSEAVRVFAKSTARQWGRDGITVNCVAVAAALAGVDPAAVGEAALSAPALGGAGDATTDLGPLVAFLCSDASHFLTGATLSADGGGWMH
jgi:NAD(P)-dependent dehydrogenase (short-subunit alcohol dehydrogenase family)